ncbi:hypothetical protein DL991_10060 [Amycolatopsis sp. WAC 01375]|uniref:hypothetical protein n=1 Tax=Amycolatopsis sp. WAC 01375 TaxID=2203194 RepID=UPI000F79377B|nr:hypothetical protein [Amycolatopsis sp. WAC 01375]RSM80465.1 hypothetical protein DL991_10060 [Amycolatopsis sp. WAC 01375]
MGYDQPVLKALRATEELASLLEADFDTDRGGFTWWHDYGLDRVAITGIMDYLYGLVSAVDENLRSAAVHLADLRENRYGEDHAVIKCLKETGHLPNYLQRTDLEARREARIHAHEAGVLRATGSILDTLAGVVIGIGGLDKSIVMADMACLEPLDEGAGYPGLKTRKKLNLTEKALAPDDPQGNLLRATRSSLLQAGPDGWLDWTRYSRNDRVHRASRIKMSIFGSNGKVARPLPRQPDHAATLGFHLANDIDTMLLTEDSQSTLTGVVESVNYAVIGTFLACSELWRARRDQPDLITQPSGQWTSAKPPRVATFNGYNPDTIAPQGDLAALVSPSTGRRLQAAKVVNRQHPPTP